MCYHVLLNLGLGEGMAPGVVGIAWQCGYPCCASKLVGKGTELYAEPISL